jgi:hypothetical protein
MAVAKKKAAPKKKAVVENKTGEKYASKAMMAKHEKGESKKMRMMEGEIPMKRKGSSVKKYTLGGPKKSIAESLSDKSKTTSVAKMRGGGKMKTYGDGGKNTVRKVPENKYAKEQIFNLKKGSKVAKAAYVATNNGTVYQIKYPESSNKASVLTMDTTGYSKGKPSYKLDFENGKGSVVSKTVKRKDVKPLLKNMKKEVISMKRGGGKMKTYGDGGKSTKPKYAAEQTPPTDAPRFRVKPPTQDSTAYYNEKSKFLRAGIGTNLLAGDIKEAAKLSTASSKAKVDAKRQVKKGKPGYDENGYPIKAANYRKGGKKSCSCGSKGCMKCGGKKYQDGGAFQTQLGKIAKSQGKAARAAGLTKKLDGMGLFEMSEMKVKPVRKGATGAQLKAEGLAMKKKGMAIKKKGQRMRNGGKK